MNLQLAFRTTWLIGIGLAVYLLDKIIWYSVFLFGLAVVTHIAVEESRGWEKRKRKD